LKNKAVFLDRDGVIIEDARHLSKFEDAKIISVAARAIALLNKSFRVIVISNQSVVARGMCKESDVEKVNNYIKRTLAKKEAKIDAIYFCPHHPDFSGACSCRKPLIGMLKDAQKKFKIDLQNSYIVGDKTVDIQTGKNAGCKTILVKTGYGGEDNEYSVQPDFVEKDVLEAAKRILLQERGN